MLTTEQLWNTFEVPIKHFILKYTHNETIAEDILQDVFLKAHMHIQTLQDEKKLQAWLYQIARHAIYDYYRSQKMIVQTLPEMFDLSVEPVLEGAEQALLPCLKEMVEGLPTLYRDALILTEYQGLTQRELAEQLHISFSGAKSRVQRAREKLKYKLLQCCHFVFDRRGGIIAYHPLHECCSACSCTA